MIIMVIINKRAQFTLSREINAFVWFFTKTQVRVLSVLETEACGHTDRIRRSDWLLLRNGVWHPPHCSFMKPNYHPTWQIFSVSKCLVRIYVPNPTLFELRSRMPLGPVFESRLATAHKSQLGPLATRCFFPHGEGFHTADETRPLSL